MDCSAPVVGRARAARWLASYRTNDGAQVSSPKHSMTRTPSSRTPYSPPSFSSARSPARPPRPPFPTPSPPRVRRPSSTLHAEGAQVYECKTGTDGALAWTFREPIATLSRTARRSAGITPVRPGNTATAARSSARLPANSPGSVAMDIPWLKLTVTSQARQRRAQGGDDRAADQHRGWKAHRRLLQAGHLSKASPMRRTTCS